MDIHIIVLRLDIRFRMVRINVEIPDDVHARLKTLASAESKGFYEWLKDDLVSTCPDEQTLVQMLHDIRRDRVTRGQKSD
jgi:hypothetical protein